MPGKVPFSVYDFQFHLSSLQNSYLNLRDGHLNELFPSIITKSFGSFGYPLLLVYPIFTFIPEAFIHLLVGKANVWLAYLLFAGFCFFLMMLSMFWCVKKLKLTNFSCLISSITYGFSSFALFNLLGGQNDISQGMIMIFLPIVFYGTFQVLVGNPEEWYWLSIGMFLIVISHLLSVVIAAFFILSLLGLLFFNRETMVQSLKRLSVLTFSAIFTVALSAFFLVPCLQILRYMGNTQLENEITSGNWPLQNYSLSLEHLFSPDQLTTGLNLIYLVALIIILIPFLKMPRIFKFLFFDLLFFTILCTNIFPWGFFQNWLGFLQKPIRLGCIPEFLIAFLFGIALELIIRNVRMQVISKSILLSLLTFLGLLATTFAFLNFQVNNKKPFMSKEQINQDDNGLISSHKLATLVHHGLTLDYIPNNAVPLRTNLKNHSIGAMNSNSNAIKQVNWSPSYNKIIYQVKLAKPMELWFPNLYFPGMNASVNDRYQKIKVGEQKQIKLKLKEGMNRVVIFYKKPLLRVVSEWVSIVAWLILGCYLFIRLLKNRKSVS